MVNLPGSRFLTPGENFFISRINCLPAWAVSETDRSRPRVYGLDEGIRSCFDLSEGERAWKKGRYSFGQILMVGDRLVVLTDKGEVVLVDVDAGSMKEVARFDAIEGKT